MKKIVEYHEKQEENKKDTLDQQAGRQRFKPGDKPTTIKRPDYSVQARS